MSSELRRLLHDFQVAFVAGTCSHVSASLVELLFPRYDARRNQALQMLEGMLSVTLHYMLGVTLFTLLVPMRYQSLPGTVWVVFSPLFLRNGYTKLLTTVAALSQQTVALLPSNIGRGDSSSNGPPDNRDWDGPLPIDPTKWQARLSAFEQAVQKELGDIAAYADRLNQRGESLDAAKARLDEIKANVPAALQRLDGQAKSYLNTYLAQRVLDARSQLRLQDKAHAFRKQMGAVFLDVQQRIARLEATVVQLEANDAKLRNDVDQIEAEIAEYRKGGPPVIVPDPVNENFPRQQGDAWIVGPCNDAPGNLQRALSIGAVSIDACGNVQPLYATDRSRKGKYEEGVDENGNTVWFSWGYLMCQDPEGGLHDYRPPKFVPSSFVDRQFQDYAKGLVCVQAKDVNGKCTYPNQPSDAMCYSLDQPTTSCVDPVFCNREFSSAASQEPYPVTCSSGGQWSGTIIPFYPNGKSSNS